MTSELGSRNGWSARAGLAAQSTRALQPATSAAAVVSGDRILMETSVWCADVAAPAPAAGHRGGILVRPCCVPMSAVCLADLVRELGESKRENSRVGYL